MRQFHDEDFRTTRSSIQAALILLSFGIGVLAFLIAIDRPEWFSMRPMSGTAVAMSAASEQPTNDAISKDQ